MNSTTGGDPTMTDQLGRIVEITIAAVIVIGVLPAAVSIGLPGGSQTVNPTVGEAAQLDATSFPDHTNVQASTGNGLEFTNESDSVESSAPKDLANGSWSVCSAAELDPNAPTNDTYSVFAYDNATILLQYDAGDWIAYYENSSGYDALARVNATSPSDGLTPVCGKYNATSNELFVVADGTYSAPQPLTNTTASRNVSKTWRGRLDEIRAFGTALSNQSIGTYQSDPIEPLPGTDRLARFMFDEGSGSTTTVYFAGTSASIEGPSWVSGVQPPSLSAGADYEVRGSPFRVYFPEGSYLEGAPIAYVSWGSGMIGLIGGFIPIFGMLLLVYALRGPIMEALP